MGLLKRFVEHLSSLKKPVSKTTIKNYRCDIAQFIKWFEDEFNKPFNPNDITPEIIELYKKINDQALSPSSLNTIENRKKLSPASLERHLSSLRKFFHFLKIENIISKNPFEAIENSLKNESSYKNKWHLNEFKNYLYVYKLSHLTIKNYVIDIKQFFGWIEEVTEIKNAWDGKKNVFEKINPRVIEEYKERLLTPRGLGGVGLSPKTINRKLSSLRKYLAFCQEQNLIKTDAEDLQIRNEKLETKHLETSGIVILGIRQMTETPESPDAKRDSGLAGIALTFPPLRLLQKTTKVIIFIFDSLLVIPLAKGIELISYHIWAIKGMPVFKETSKKNPVRLKKTKQRFGIWNFEFKNYSKAFYAPLSISTRSFSLPKKVWHHIKHTRPKWYKAYHKYPIAHYFHFAILVICMSAIGFALYNHFIFQPQIQSQNKTVLSAQDNYPHILAFKGRLTDSSDNPITSANTPIRVSVYNDPIASGANLLWQEVVLVNPNQDGLFETTVGKSVPIPKTVFQNPSLYLGISVGQTEELFPRQQLATASLAFNSQTLQGMPAITDKEALTRNVILALDSSGNLSIGGEATPVFQAVGGQFTLSGKVLLLTTVKGSDGDVVISADGLGKIDLQKPLQNTSDNNNIASAIGAVEVDDLLAVLATSSGQSAFTINQDGTGPIISASSSGTAKFTVENNGNIISGNGANWQPTFDSSSGLNIASSSGIPFVTFDTLHQSVGIGTVVPDASLDVLGSFRATGDINLSKFISNGGIIYATKSGSLAQVAAGTSSQCLLGGETPKFGNCVSYDNIKESSNNIGIGTTTPLFKLDVQDSQSATAAAQIFNTNNSTNADGLIVKLGNDSTTEVSSDNHFISFETAGIGIVGSVKGNGAKGVVYETSGVADFAEYFKKDQNQTIEYGSLVCLDQKGMALACDKDNTNIVGVASEHPAFLGGENLGNKSIAVGLTGQVYARASNVNGDIKPGDPLTNSAIPGVAVKATKAGYIIGKALESCGLTKFSNETTPRTVNSITDDELLVKYQNGVDSEGVEPSRPTFLGSAPKPSEPTPHPLLCSKILTLVNVSWYDPDVYLTHTGDLSIVQKTQNDSEYSENSENQNVNVSDILSVRNSDLSGSPSFPSFPKFSLVDAFRQTIDRIGAFSQIIVANLQVGFLKAEEISAQKIISPIAEVDEIHTNIISPLASDSLKIHLGGVHSATSEVNTNGKLIIENASGSAVATIDSSGNASFSGSLTANNLEVNNDATISGTLRAKSIVAESIEGLEAKVSTLAAEYIQNTRNTQNASTSDTQTVRSSDPSADGLISPIASGSPSLLSFPNQNLTSSFGTFTLGLMSFGPTSLAETAITGNLYIQETLILAANSINVLGHDLELQPLRQGGISFLSGLMQIDKDGNVKVLGNAEFAKDVSIKGDLIASGSGTFRKINLSIVEPALAISQTEIIATGSAGVSAIKAYQTEVTIINKLITDKSLIYITPVGTPSAATPFLMRQTPAESAGSGSVVSGAEPVEESFTVGVQTQAASDTLFNWLIVN